MTTVLYMVTDPDGGWRGLVRSVPTVAARYRSEGWTFQPFEPEVWKELRRS